MSIEKQILDAINHIILHANDPSGSPVELTADGDGRLFTTTQGALAVTEQRQAPFGATVTALDANDAVGNMMEFTVPKMGRILSVKFIDPADQTSALTLHIYSKPFVAAASDAAYTISDEDALNWVTNVTPTMIDEGASQVGEVIDIDSEYLSPSGRLYAQFSTTGTPTFTQATMPLAQMYILPLGD